MWEVDNRTPYKTDRTWVQDKEGAKHWVVVVKGTFDIGLDGQTKLADQQAEVVLVPEYSGEDGFSSLRYETDMTGVKPGTDVYVNGKAFAPNGRPTTKTTVGLRIANAPLKVLEVLGDRTYERDVGQVVPSAPMPFLEMPITYERAYGGFDNEDPDPGKQKLHAVNPAGTGVAMSAAKLIGRPAPNIALAGGRKDDRACGFGAISSWWKPRIDYGGTYDAKWINERKPLLPLDFDHRFLMCAPADQQFIPHLRGGELVEVANMSPSGSIRFALPKIYLACETQISTRRKSVRHRCFLYSVVIEPEVPRVVLTWHTTIPCHHDMDYLESTVVREKPYI